MGEKNKDNFFKKIICNIYIKNILLMGIIAFVIICLTLLGLSLYTRHNQKVAVPDLNGLSENDARAILISSNLKCEVIDSIFSDKASLGSILEQIPKANSHVKEGRTIYLTIQKKQEPLISIPDLEDSSLRQSEALLSTLGFTKVKTKYVSSAYKDLVYSVEYNGAKLKSGDKVPLSGTITIYVGDGKGSANFRDDSVSSDTDTSPELGQPIIEEENF